jgi:hypothetical protein
MGAGRLDRGVIPHPRAVVEMLAWPRDDSGSACHRSDLRLPHRGGSRVIGASMEQRAAVMG